MSGTAPRVAAERVVAAPLPAVFDFLADLENHWLLTDRFVEVLTLERPAGGGPAHGGRVRIRGPLGIVRTAETRVAEAHPPRWIAGTASVGGRWLGRRFDSVLATLARRMGDVQSSA